MRRVSDKAYYERTRDKQAEGRKAYRIKNKDSHKEWDSNYYKTPERRYNHSMNSAKQRFIPWELSMDEFMTFWQKPCDYCADEIKFVGLDRVDPSKGYEIENVVSCCKHCNFAKHLFNEEEFINHCKKIVDNYENKKILRLVK